jgi:hypothetical protein
LGTPPQVWSVPGRSVRELLRGRMKDIVTSIRPLVGLVVICLLPAMHDRQSALAESGAPGPATVTMSVAAVTNMVKELNSAGSALFDLAGERFAAVEKRREVWIMALHSADESFHVLKYTDGKVTVVALPVVGPDDELGLRKYVDHYNRFNIKSADLAVKDRRYKDAREIYTLLQHFNPRSALTEGVKRRLVLLEQIEKGEDTERKLKEFADLFTDVGPSFLAGMDDSSPVRVTNLLEINLSR